MTALTSTLPLQLHLVPAGRRLDFTTTMGRFAYVYRRCQHQGRQCVARNACSPFLDTATLEPEAAPEYFIRYRDASGATLGATSVVRADPVGFPAWPNWVRLQ